VYNTRIMFSNTGKHARSKKNKKKTQPNAYQKAEHLKWNVSSLFGGKAKRSLNCDRHTHNPSIRSYALCRSCPAPAPVSSSIQSSHHAAVNSEWLCGQQKWFRFRGNGIWILYPMLRYFFILALEVLPLQLEKIYECGFSGWGFTYNC